MPATVHIEENNTAGNVPTNKTSGTIRYKSADNSTVDINNPLVQPTSGAFRSYEKWLRLDATVAPTGQISSPVFYTNGTNNYGTGIDAYARTTNPGTYSTPTVPANDAAGTDSFTYTSVSPKALDVANPGPFTGTGQFGDYLVMWMTILSTCAAPQDPTASAVLTFAWNEI